MVEIVPEYIRCHANNMEYDRLDYALHRKLPEATAEIRKFFTTASIEEIEGFLCTAGYYGNTTMFRMLENGCTRIKEIDFVKVFSITKYTGELREYILRLDINVQRKSEDGKTMLHWAVEYKDLLTVQALVRKGADLLARDNENMTPFLTASRLGQIEILRAVVKLYSINNVGLNGYTALQFAIAYVYIEAVHLILGQGGDPNITNERGENAAHIACRVDIEFTRILMINQADIFARDNNERSTLHHAVKNFHHTAPQIITLLLRKGIFVDSRDKDGQTPTHLAVRDDTAVLEILLKGEANVNANDKFQHTCVDIAISKHSPKALKILMDYHAQMNYLNYRERTPLYEAYRKDYAEECALLLDFGSAIYIETGPTFFSDEFLPPRSSRLIIYCLAIAVTTGQPTCEEDLRGLCINFPESYALYLGCLKELEKLRTISLVHPYSMMDLTLASQSLLDQMTTITQYERRVAQYPWWDFPIFGRILRNIAMMGIEKGSLWQHLQSSTEHSSEEGIYNSCFHRVAYYVETYSELHQNKLNIIYDL